MSVIWVLAGLALWAVLVAVAMGICAAAKRREEVPRIPARDARVPARD